MDAPKMWPWKWKSSVHLKDFFWYSSVIEKWILTTSNRYIQGFIIKLHAGIRPAKGPVNIIKAGVFAYNGDSQIIIYQSIINNVSVWMKHASLTQHDMMTSSHILSTVAPGCTPDRSTSIIVALNGKVLTLLTDPWIGAIGFIHQL